MLMITRRPGERILVGDDISIHVVEIVGNSVRIGVDAPRSVPVYREEIWAAAKEENRGPGEGAGPKDLPQPAARAPEGLAPVIENRPGR
ncbi:MAG: hypothetical protein NVS4B3_26770 [Gemmatimonadaceae bacterium]